LQGVFLPPSWDHLLSQGSGAWCVVPGPGAWLRGLNRFFLQCCVPCRHFPRLLASPPFDDWLPPASYTVIAPAAEGQDELIILGRGEDLTAAGSGYCTQQPNKAC
jgi:hypothetical protein